ncbi:hypothetical protein N8603_05295, partial [Verrucomicrobiales bacterium]|nr:hypothetical protein [Verrucomicrobiales bacterium]
PLLLLCSEDGRRISTNKFKGEFESDKKFSLIFSLRSDLSGDSFYKFNYDGDKPIRFFSAANQEFMVEEPFITESGYCYFLLSSHGDKLFNNWYDEYGRSSTIVDNIPQSGLAEGYSIRVISNIENLDEIAREKFPVANIRKKRGVKIAKLLEGTRVRTGGARKAYLYYDLPYLICQSTTEPTITSSQAEFNLVYRPSSNLPSTLIWEFEIKLLNEPSIVVASIQVDGKDESIAFGVYRDQNQFKWEIIQEDLFRVNKFGRPAKDIGLRGVILDESELLREQDSIDLEEVLAKQFGDHDEGLIDRGFRFIESVFVEKNRLIPTKEVHRKAQSIQGLNGVRFYNELRWLRDLAFVEIKTDDKGRWTHCIHSPISIVLLPITINGQYQAVLAGCMKVSMAKIICEKARNFGICVSVSDQGKNIVPPRICLSHQRIDCLESFASELGVYWNDTPPAKTIAYWAASMNDWEQDIGSPWYEGRGPDADGGYIPEKFQSIQGESFSCPFKLENVEDTLTGRHRLFKVIKNNFGEKKYAFVRDPQWAKWMSNNRASVHLNGLDPDEVFELLGTEDLILVDYDIHTKSLYLPRELSLPYVLSRALTMCNGKVPEEIETIKGVYFVYSPVPEKFCKMILEKVLALPFAKK